MALKVTVIEIQKDTVSLMLELTSQSVIDKMLAITKSRIPSYCVTVHLKHAENGEACFSPNRRRRFCGYCLRDLCLRLGERGRADDR